MTKTTIALLVVCVLFPVLLLWNLTESRHTKIQSKAERTDLCRRHTTPLENHRQALRRKSQHGEEVDDGINTHSHPTLTIYHPNG